MTTFKNPLVNLFQAMADVVNRFMEKDRAVNIGAIWQTVQEQLDAASGGGGMEGDMAMPMSSSYVLDIYTEEAGVFAIVTKSDGKLYKLPVTVDANSQVTLGTQQEVVMDFTPVTGRQVTIKRQADGQVRWFAMPACTAVLNRSGEIDSRALFDSFVDHVERSGVYPELDFFHMGEYILLGKADWVARDGYSYCASGTFYDTPIARAAIKALEENKDYWGLSIAYLPTSQPEQIRSSEGIQIPVFNVGINRFISLLPEDTAASILTSISTKEEVNRMNDKVAQALKALTGDDAALFKELSDKIDSVNRSADGMINRETPATAEVQTPTATASTTQSPAPVQTRAMDPADQTALLASQEFKDAVTTIFNDLYSQQNAVGDKPAEAAATPAPVAPENRANDAVLQLLAELTDQVTALSKSREAEVEEVLNDLPSKIAKTQIVRPRAIRLPQDVRTRTNVSLADVAAATLATMDESQ